MKPTARFSKGFFLFLVVSALIAAAPRSGLATAPSTIRLHGHVPMNAIATATRVERVPPSAGISLALSLPLRETAELDTLLESLYTPGDPRYGRYLSSAEFTERFGPTQADYDALIAWATSVGLKVTATHANRALLDVAGPAGAVEAAFKLHLHHYLAPDGRKFYAPDNDPEVPDFVASRIGGVIGLDNAALRRPQSRYLAAADATQAPNQIGTGPGGGLTPSDIRTAYSLNGVSATSTGQTLAVFELDGYNASDIAGYVSYYGLPPVPLQNVLVDGFSGRAGSGAGEVTLDIELQIALAPGASKIMVYEGPNTNTGVVDTYNRIATDNLAKQISTSWGLSEGQSSSAVLNAENTAFKQMAAQGQSIFAASGDSGAYDNGSTLSVDDPASQPYMTGVGGTQLFVNSGETYNHETTWNLGSASAGAGGGGVSTVWSLPYWQLEVNSGASSTMRNVPDVSLNADQYTGYSIFYKNGWYVYGGTSCSSPLWAAFTARVNQQRAANGLAPVGFANPTVYQIALGTRYGSDFHDVADGSTNLYYPATTGYDNATGWGSFNGGNLYADLATWGSSVTPPAAPTGLTATAGDGTVTLTWNASSGATSYSVYRGTASGLEASTPVMTGLTATTYSDTVTNGVTYYYKVSASNSAGTSALSNEASATPGAAPLVITSGPTASVSLKAKSASALIQWNTSAPSDSTVQYWPAGGTVKSVSSATAVTAHSLTLSSLIRKTTYSYQVTSTANGTSVTSPVRTFAVN